MSTETDGYTVVVGDDPDKLGIDVSEYIKQGWRPHGSMSLAHSNYGTTFYQPMVLLPIEQ